MNSCAPPPAIFATSIAVFILLYTCMLQCLFRKRLAKFAALVHHGNIRFEQQRLKYKEALRKQKVKYEGMLKKEKAEQALQDGLVMESHQAALRALNEARELEKSNVSAGFQAEMQHLEATLREEIDKNDVLETRAMDLQGEKEEIREVVDKIFGLVRGIMEAVRQGNRTPGKTKHSLSGSTFPRWHDETKAFPQLCRNFAIDVEAQWSTELQLLCTKTDEMMRMEQEVRCKHTECDSVMGNQCLTPPTTPSPLPSHR